MKYRVEAENHTAYEWKQKAEEWRVGKYIKPTGQTVELSPVCPIHTIHIDLQCVGAVDMGNWEAEGIWNMRIINLLSAHGKAEQRTFHTSLALPIVFYDWESLLTPRRD